MSLEDENKKILEYNLSHVFGGAVRLIRGYSGLAEGSASLVKTGISRDTQEIGEGQQIAARAILPRPTFPFPAAGDRIEDIATSEVYTIVSIGRFSESSVEVICQFYKPEKTGKSTK